MAWGEKFNKVTQSAISKSKEVSEVSRLNKEIEAVRQQVRGMYTQVGEYVMTNGLLLEDETIQGFVKQMEDFDRIIAEKEEKIREVRNVTICPKCQAEVERTSKFCSKCGALLVTEETAAQEEAPATKICKNCGSTIDADAVFCGSCGAKQDA